MELTNFIHKVSKGQMYKPGHLKSSSVICHTDKIHNNALQIILIFHADKMKSSLRSVAERNTEHVEIIRVPGQRFSPVSC